MVDIAPLAVLTPLARNFLGRSPNWYKASVAGFLLLNPALLFTFGPFVTGWALLLQFIVCLTMALRCHPLPPGGLLALEALALGLTSADEAYAETARNVSVLLLLMFMVAGIFFMRELLLWTFTRVLRIRSQTVLALAFCSTAALLSAFLDALTVTAMMIAVADGFYAVFHRYASGRRPDDAEHDHANDTAVAGQHRADLQQFRAFLRGLLMHGLVGTALGGVATLVGEPQNLLIGEAVGWHFAPFLRAMAHVSAPTFVTGILTCLLLERLHWFGFGVSLPDDVRAVLNQHSTAVDTQRRSDERARLAVQALAALLLFIALGFHLAEVGLTGLGILVLQAAFNGVVDEHRLGEAFHEALPFTALLVVFFVVVSVIHDQGLFAPIVDFVLGLGGQRRLGALYVATGALSAISDNVFVATVYLRELQRDFIGGVISQREFEHLAVSVNAGTNIPSIATPNGQAAFLFLLTSGLAPVLRISYSKMLWMALPYTVVLTLVGFLATVFIT